MAIRGSRIGPRTFRHAVLTGLGRIAAQVAGVHLSVLYVLAGESGEVSLAPECPERHPFCRLIRSSPDGPRLCRTCHLLIASVEGNGAPREHRCHAGASILVASAGADADFTLAVLGTSRSARTTGWSEARARGAELGIDLRALKEAYFQLPKLTSRQTEAAGMLLEVAVEAARAACTPTAAAVSTKPDAEVTGSGMTQAVLQAFHEQVARIPDTTPGAMERPYRGRGRASWLIASVERLIRKRMDLPLTVKELSTAARMTPNHFSMIFRRNTGKRFCQYLADVRVEAATALLRNPALQIAEVARQVGYARAAYFTRQFRRATGLSPLAWSARHLSA